MPIDILRPASRQRAHLLLACALAPLYRSVAAREASLRVDDPALRIDGAWFSRRSASTISFHRHDQTLLRDPASGISAASLPYALTQAGARLRFRTRRARLGFTFANRAGTGQMGLRHGFALFANGALLREFDRLAFEADAPATGIVDYELTLPSYQGVELTSMRLAPGHGLLALPIDARPGYVAFGDSITNGLGQQSGSHLAYPFLVAQSLGWHLTNLGVSGARTGAALAHVVQGRKADVITIALGFNDWFWSERALADVAAEFNLLLATLRALQPHALLVAITPIASSADPSQARAPYSLDQLREVQRTCVAQRQHAGDAQLHVLRGETLSQGAALIDGIHLGIDGAAAYAGTLAAALAQLARQHRRRA